MQPDKVLADPTANTGIQPGMSDDEIVAIRAGPSAPGFASNEKAVLQLVDEIVTDGVASSEVLSAARAAAESDLGYLELLAIPGCYAALASILDALEVPLDDGVTSWPPDGLHSPRRADPFGARRRRHARRHGRHGSTGSCLVTRCDPLVRLNPTRP